MELNFKRRLGGRVGIVLVALSLTGLGQGLQLVTTRDPSQPAPSGGSGDSWAPIISADGRFVLFSSTADNLVLTTNNTALPAPTPRALNVFLRDRTNGTTTLVSVNLTGVAGGNSDSFPAGISTNGRYALFESSASDLVAGDTNNVGDIFLRDLLNGTTSLISASTNGSFGNGVSRDSAMTPDAHWVAFVSAANNLVPGDTNRIADVFVRDVQAGTTILASVGAVSTNTGPALGSSEAPQITPNGQFVVFSSTATNLVPGVPAGGDVYVRDLVNGTTTWASTGARAAVLAKLGSSSASCYNHIISGDGQFVAYEASRASNPGPNYSALILRYNLGSGSTDLIHTNAMLGSGASQDLASVALSADGRFVAFIANTNGTAGTTTCVCVWDAQESSVMFVSTGLDGTVPAASTCDWPALSADGRCLAFLSTATNLVTNTLSAGEHLFARELQAGVTTLVDADPSGTTPIRGPATAASLSDDGRFIAFDCSDGNLVPNDRNRDSDIFVRDLTGGGTEMISVREPSLPSAPANGLSFIGPGALSGDGRYLAFVTDADNLAPNDTNSCRDVFVRDLIMGTPCLVSAATNGFAGDGQSSEPSITADGRYVAFTSGADNLVAADTNRTQDVFVRDLQTGSTILASVRNDGAQANGPSYSPTISANGRYVLFRSKASNLASFLTGAENLYLRDLQVRATYALTTGGLIASAMTPDGRFVTMVDGITTIRLYVWDSLAGARIYTNALSVTPTSMGISPDGNKIVYWSGSTTQTLTFFDRLARTSQTIATSSGPITRPILRFSAENQVLAYNRKDGGTGQVYLFDFITGANLLLTGSYNATGAGNGDSDSPDISGNGRFIAYRSAATNLAPGDTNGIPDIFLFDRQTGSNSLLSTSLIGNSSANNRSFAPVFSPDGHTLCFASWASDIAPLDFNHYSDIFAFGFFYAMILPGADSGHGPWLTWPMTPGSNYRVQYKDALSDADWQDLSGTVTNQGNKAWLQDLNPAKGQRFYRIRAY